MAHQPIVLLCDREVAMHTRLPFSQTVSACCCLQSACRCLFHAHTILVLIFMFHNSCRRQGLDSPLCIRMCLSRRLHAHPLWVHVYDGTSDVEWLQHCLRVGCIQFPVCCGGGRVTGRRWREARLGCIAEKNIEFVVGFRRVGRLQRSRTQKLAYQPVFRC